MSNRIAYVENTSDRIVVQMVPQSSPGQCGICGKGSDENGFVDPRLDFEFYGSLIFCSYCTSQMAAIFGMIPADVYEDIVADNGILQLELREKNKQLEEMGKIIDGFTNTWMHRNNMVSDSVIDTSIQLPEANKEPIIDPEPTNPQEQPELTAGPPAKPATVGESSIFTRHIDI